MRFLKNLKDTIETLEAMKAFIQFKLKGQYEKIVNYKPYYSDLPIN